MNQKNIKKARADSAAGISLLEVLACAAILAVVINLAAGAFITSTRLSVLGTSALDRMQAVDEIRNGFTSTVRESSAVVPTLSKYRSGNEQLILELTHDTGREGAKRYAVFGPIGSESRLSRLVVLEKDGRYTIASFMTYPLDLDSIRFSYDTGDMQGARLVSLEFGVKNERRVRRPRPAHKFTAAMRAM